MKRGETMDAIYTYQGAVSSELEQIKPFVEDVLKRIKEYIFDEETIFDLKLILDELVVNGALHGNELNQEKYVYLNVVLKDTSITIRVVDEGCGIIEYSSNDCFNSEKCSGRGLILVEALTDKLVFNKNEVIVLKHF